MGFFFFMKFQQSNTQVWEICCCVYIFRWV